MKPGLRRPRLAMVVLNDITGDSRVKKTAVSARRLGFNVVVFGFASSTFETEMAGIRLVRVSADPIPPAPSPFFRQSNGRLAINPLAPFAFRSREQLEQASARLAQTQRNGTKTAKVAARIRLLVFRIRRKGFVGSGWASMGALLQRLDRSEPTIKQFLRRRLPGLVEPSQAMADAVAEFMPDLIHAHDITTLQIPPLIGELHGLTVPWVYDAHELVPGIHSSDSGRTTALIDLERRWAPQADQVICVSNPLAEILHSSLSLRSRPRTVLNAPPSNPNPNVKGLRSRIGIGDDCAVIVYPGVVKPMRGLDTVVDALGKLPSVRLVLVSDPASPGVRELFHHAEQIGVADRLHAVPYVAASDVSALISDATIGIHPLRHYANAEIALPTKLFEFLHAGLPVVVSDTAEMARFVRQYGIGSVFSAGNVEACVTAISETIENAETIRCNITTHLKATHCWEWQENELSQAYADALQANLPAVNAGFDFNLAETDREPS